MSCQHMVLNAVRQAETDSLQGEGVAVSARLPIASDGKAEEFCGNILRYHKLPVSKSTTLENGQENAVQGSIRGTDSTIGAGQLLPYSLSAIESSYFWNMRKIWSFSLCTVSIQDLLGEKIQRAWKCHCKALGLLLRWALLQVGLGMQACLLQGVTAVAHWKEQWQEMGTQVLATDTNAAAVTLSSRVALS